MGSQENKDLKIWVHTLVKNEERYLWFAVSSVIKHVDKVLLWDTGSTDNTVEIIRKLIESYPNKIDFKEIGEVDTNEFTSIRKQMLEATKSDWIIIVDGDEVWWESSIEYIVDLIINQGKNLDSIVVGYENLMGDIFHHELEKFGGYQIDNVRGNITIRAINRYIPGLHVSKPHGQQGFFDGKGNLIQNLNKKRRKLVQGKSYLHFTHLPRSNNSNLDRSVPKREGKYRRELGAPFSLDFFYPEVFFRSRPDFIESPWTVAPKSYKIRREIVGPLKSFKRKLNRKSGY